MKAGFIITSIASIAILIFVASIYLHYGNRTQGRTSSPSGFSYPSQEGNTDISELLKVLHQQNETIFALGQALQTQRQQVQKASSEIVPDGKELVDLLKIKEAEIEKLLKEQQHMGSQSHSRRPSEFQGDPSSHRNAHDHIADYLVSPTRFEQDCESRYGLELVDTWKKNKSVN